LRIRDGIEAGGQRRRLVGGSVLDVRLLAYDTEPPRPWPAARRHAEATPRKPTPVLFGAVGDWKYDKLERQFRPEQAILGLRKNLGLFANFRPAPSATSS
jgi:hypothetical protein